MNIWELLSMNEAQAADKPDAKILYNPRSKSAEFGSMFVPPAGKRLPGMPSVLAPGRAPAQEGVAPEEAQAQAQPAPQTEPAPTAPGQPASTGSPYAAIKDMNSELESLRSDRLAQLSQGRDRMFSGLEKTINEMNDYKDRSTFQKLDLSPGLAFVDSLTGSNLQKGYTAPETMEELRRKLADYQSKMVGEQNKAIDSITDSMKTSGARTPMERALAGFNKEADKLEEMDAALVEADKLISDPRGLAKNLLFRKILVASGEDRLSDKDLLIASQGNKAWAETVRQWIQQATDDKLTKDNEQITRQVLDTMRIGLIQRKLAKIRRYAAGSDMVYGADVSPAMIEAILRLKLGIDPGFQNPQREASPVAPVRGPRTSSPAPKKKSAIGGIVDQVEGPKR